MPRQRKVAAGVGCGLQTWMRSAAPAAARRPTARPQPARRRRDARAWASRRGTAARLRPPDRPRFMDPREPHRGSPERRDRVIDAPDARAAAGELGVEAAVRLAAARRRRGRRPSQQRLRTVGDYVALGRRSGPPRSPRPTGGRRADAGARAVPRQDPMRVRRAGAGRPPVVLDMSTSGVAGGKLRSRCATGAAIPAGWALPPRRRHRPIRRACSAGGALLRSAGRGGQRLQGLGLAAGRDADRCLADGVLPRRRAVPTPRRPVPRTSATSPSSSTRRASAGGLPPAPAGCRRRAALPLSTWSCWC